MSRRIRRVLLLPALLALAAGVALAAGDVGKKAPEITGKDLLTGKSVKLSSLAGKPVLLDFFATW